MQKLEVFTDLIAWKKAHELALGVYKVTEVFPDTEKFGLVVQLRRSAVSVTSNLSEGFGRRGRADKIRFYDIAIGSLYEAQNQLILSHDLNYVSKDSFARLFDLSIEVRKLTISLIASVRS